MSADPNYSYTVIWTNLNTGVMDSYTVAENTNSHSVTGLSDNDNYNVTITAVGVCGMITSDPITVYGECVIAITYNVSLHVIVVGSYIICTVYVVRTYTHVCLQESIVATLVKLMYIY